MERFRPEDYTVGWLCALPIELNAATEMLDEQHRDLPQQADHPNLYTLGRINTHNVVILCLPAGQTGNNSAGVVIGQMRSMFPSIRHMFMVGVGGGVPGNNAAIQLGDVVVSQPHMGYGGVVQYDFGKSTPGGFIRNGFVNAPPPILLCAVNKLRANYLKHQANISKALFAFSQLRGNAGPDILFKPNYEHVGGAECDMCDKNMVMHRTQRGSDDIVVHYGTIASGNQLIRDGVVRDKLSLELGGVLCFEMEAAGFMSAFPGLVIRGICDYADSHKNKKWQPYAAVTAAILAKEILSILPVAQDAMTKETDFELDNLGRFSALSKRPEWSLVQDGTLPFDIFDHISDYDPNDTYCSYLRDRCPGTATWILRDKKFLAWKKQTPSCLWLSGKIGSGKTHVTTAVIQDIIEASQKGGDFVAHFFFNYSTKSRLKAVHLFSSYIKQMLGFLEIIKKTCPGQLADAVKRLYGPRKCRPCFAEIRDSIFIPLGKFLNTKVPSATYIVDGLDECEPEERRLVLSTFRDIIQQRGPQRVLVSGREDLHVTDFITGSTTLCISKKDNEEDIQQFIEWKLQAKMLERQLTENEDVLRDIKSQLNKRADLMRILWVNMQIEALWEECSTDNDIQDALKNLPKNLDETYARCLTRIDKRQNRFAPRILRWVSAAIKPFQADQLSEALAIDPSTGCLDRGEMPTRQEIVKCCSNLITSNNGRVLLAHQSVSQFLRKLDSGPLNASFQLDTAQLELGQLCVTHLMSSDYSLALQSCNIRKGSQIIMGAQTMKTLIETPLPSLVRRFLPRIKPATVVLPRKVSKPPSAAELPVFFQYAKDQWAPLTRSITEKSLYWDKFCTLALEPNLSWQLHPWSPLGESLDSHYSGLLGWAIVSRHLSLLDLLFRLHDRKPKNDIFNVPFYYYNNLPALHLASRTGDTEIIKRLLQVCNLKKIDNNHRTALHHAAEMGHSDIIVLLIQKKANLKAKDDRGRTALHSAAECGHDRVVQALADGGTNVNQKDNSGCTALWLAARNSHEAVVTLLVENGADVETKDSHGSTALLWAANNGYEAVVKLLVEKGADVEAKDKGGWTALLLAAENGHEAVVKLLVENGAEIKAKNEDGWMALLLAAKSGHEAVVKLLVKKGADVKVKDKDGWTALLLAAINGHEAVVKLLVENSAADVEAKNEDGWTALLLAAKSGHEAVVKLLVEKGADVEAKDEDSWTALFWAARNGHEAVVKLLIESSADVEAKDEDSWTALLLAAKSGQEAVVKLLVEKGADVEAKDEDSWTALLLAAKSGHEAVVKLLVEKGADVEAKDEDSWTALFWAARNGHEAVVKLLIENSAEVEKSNIGQTALLLAAENGHEAVVKLLVEKGADVEATDKYGWTALMRAAKNGHEAVVKLLVKKGADVEAKDKDSWTALLWAAKRGHEAVVKLLVEKGANVEAKDKYDQTALLLAAERGHEAVVKLLVEKGADVEAKDKYDQTALLLAAESGHKAVVKLLVEKGADVEAKDKDDQTALLLAAESRHKAVVELLVENGAADIRPRPCNWGRPEN
ncbi:hypothetical protein QQS21_012296 [Conoideocrella luteorostrata]|uniref:Nucleoside phosphorylase domain-containing protein n=1 Tax=Conoideocrella luteorostrata TaxID=1105319 RepID=A0AAJ0CBG7_9HYPO|nr:hypothetical protein QQS21_012296 [Conoideocrella luteorostrata]